MTEYTDLDRIIDSKNKELWEDLRQHYTITIYSHDLPYAEVFSKYKVAQIYVNSDINSASFTHELLHLWIEKKEIYIGSIFKLIVREKSKLKKVFSDRLLTHIGNTCEHIKMYPMFLSMGYSENQFLQDNEDCKCTETSLKEIEAYYRFLWAYRAKAIDVYIGKFFAINADRNGKFDYSSCRKRLKNVDPLLYEILNTFWENWSNYDLAKEDGVNISYHQIAFEFFDNFEIWIKPKFLI